MIVSSRIQDKAQKFTDAQKFLQLARELSPPASMAPNFLKTDSRRRAS